MPSLECEVCLELYNESRRIPRTLSCNHILCTSCIFQLLRKGPLKCPFCRSLHNREIISAVDIPVHQALMSMVSEGLARIPGDADNDSSQTEEEETSLNIVKLRADITKAAETGSIFCAVLTTSDGQTRHAKVTMLSDRIHLHALKDGPPPAGSTVIPYEKLRTLADEVYVVTFLEITLNGVVQGYVYIRLLDDAGRTCQFLYFSTGERGPSYADTRFFEVLRKGELGEQVWCGDYENNDGSGGAALPGIVRGPQNHQTIMPGLLAGFYFPGYGCDHNPSQFGIYTKAWEGINEMSSIGRVLSGLEMLSNIAQLDDYDKIRSFEDDVDVVTFLEITWNGVVQGHVYIRLLDDAGRTRQFLYFCTGEQGPSYAQTRFLEVTLKGEPGEQVWGGDYENNDGSGGTALPGMSRGPKNHQDVSAGLVAGFYYSGYDQDHNPSQFGIYTRDLMGYSEMSSMGRVIYGLETICSVAQLQDVREAFVSDCGILLFH